MNFVFVINSLEDEKACNTTPLLMCKAHQRGHDVYVMSVGDFSYNHSKKSSVNVRYISKKKKITKPEQFLEELNKKGKEKKLFSKDIDVLFIRNNPTEENSDRVWAEHAGIAFGKMIQQEGALVLNDAYALSTAFIDKLYFEELPAEIKPDSLITRKKEEIMDFYENNSRNIVLKPLEGSGGQNVYHIDENEHNINQIIDTIRKEGYVIAQEYLPEVQKGDVRVILMNGRILEEDGHKAIIRRVAGDGEFRSNFSLGANAEKAELTSEMQKIVDLTAPQLIRDGLFLVGLDIVDDKLIEINVLSPGGLERMDEIGLPDFSTSIIEAVERKLVYKNTYENKVSNRVLATMI